MRNRFKALLAVALAALLALGLVAPSGAGARPAAAIKITGGSSTLTTAPGLVAKLLGAQIVSFVTAPGSQTLVPSKTGGTLRATYPVSRGVLTTKPRGGTFAHRGGLLIVNTGNGQKAMVDNFVVDLTHRVLTARLVAIGKRATIFNLNLKHIAIRSSKHLTTISKIGLSLEENAAKALNAALGTTAFKPGLKFGTAVSRLRH